MPVQYESLMAHKQQLLDLIGLCERCEGMPSFVMRAFHAVIAQHITKLMEMAPEGSI